MSSPAGTEAGALATTSTSSTTTTTTIPVVSITGRVTESNGAALPLRVFVSSGGVTTHTGPDGWFSFEVADPDSISVSKPGWTGADVAWTDDVDYYEVSIQQRVIRGLRVGAEAAGDDTAFRGMLDLASATAVNAFVFDTKQEGGRVLYDTSVQEAHEIGAVDVFYDPVARIGEAHDAGLYAITRIVTFEDELRARGRPEEKLAGRWVSPLVATAAEYNIGLAVEACEMGFDEIMFDYVRFPSGQTAAVSGQLEMSQDERVAAIAGFLSRARQALHPLGCSVSAAIFGIVVSSQDDQGLGQRPEELSAQLDAVSPMIYPSHYSPGWLGFEDPNDHPYDVTADAIDDAIPRLAPGTILRPWHAGGFGGRTVRSDDLSTQQRTAMLAGSSGMRPATSTNQLCPAQPRSKIDQSKPPTRTSGAPIRAASAVSSSGLVWESRSASTRAR